MKPLFTTLLLLLVIQLSAQENLRTLCVFDMQERNGETNDSRVFSIKHMAQVAGIPIYITDDLTEALTYGIVFASSEFKGSTFDAEEVDAIKDFVSAGGTLVASRIEDDDFFDLFGISEDIPLKTRYKVTWDTDAEPGLFRWINEDWEKTISLGRETTAEIYKTIAYEVDGAKALGHFDDGSIAFITNSFGAGTVYSFGISIKEVILRNQINRDYEAQRISSNGFEPTQDVFCFLLRNIFNKHVPYNTWKYTSPYNSSSTLLITHDIDSRTAIDSLLYFVKDEEARGIVATYNMTLRYFDDEIMSPFYAEGKDVVIPYILDHGHTFGSHSVGHFFDFADDDIFPIGEKGNTMENYSPFNDGDITSGGTIYGECEVSKNVLEEDTGQEIRIFRAGHLAYPRYLINVLEDLGYDYDTNFSAADVLTNFPYRTKTNRSFSGAHSRIIEIPVTISDVFHSDPISAENMNDKVDIWMDVLQKNDANHANTCLLIHPNRGYKAVGQEDFLDKVPNTVLIQESVEFGDYWRTRMDVLFSSKLKGDELTLILDPASYNNDEQISFVVNDGQDLNKIYVLDQLGNSMELLQSDWGENDVIVYHEAPVDTSVGTINKVEADLVIFPNPVSDGIINLEFSSNQNGPAQLNVYDINGQLKHQEVMDIGYGKQVQTTSLDDLTMGTYIVELVTDRGHLRAKMVKF